MIVVTLVTLKGIGKKQKYPKKIEKKNLKKFLN